MLAMTYSPFKESTIGARRLNFRVRNENGWTPSAESPTYKIRTESWVFVAYISYVQVVHSINCYSHVQYSLQEIRLISTPRLRSLPNFHLVPINQIIFLET